MEQRRFIIAKLEVEIRVLGEELIILENQARKMDLPQLLAVWQPEIISSKLNVQLINIGEEHEKRRKKRKRKANTTKHNSSIQHGGVLNSAQSLDPVDGEGTYLSDVRRRIREVLEDQAKTGGEDREGGFEE